MFTPRMKSLLMLRPKSQWTAALKPKSVMVCQLEKAAMIEL